MAQACITIQEQTDVAEVRRRALALASNSFDETSAGNLSLVVTEAATNLLKHAGGGQIILSSMELSGAAGIEMLALDKGPGIIDLRRCSEDGYSTAGTPGTGLGAIARLSSFHEIYSQPGQGTVLMAQLWNYGLSHRRPAMPAQFSAGGVSVALPGEEECGDAWIFQEGASGSRVTMADGLGHGVFASEAAQAAIGIARAHPQEPALALLERIHGALRATRGAAVAVAEIDPAARELRFVGVGNINATIVPHPPGPIRHLVSYAGTAGHEVRKIQQFTYPWDSRSLLVMHSDGLQTHWSLDRYPGLLERSPGLISGLLYRDYARGRDDATVVVVRETERQP